MHQRQDGIELHSVTCLNVLPAKKVKSIKEKGVNNAGMSMTIQMKLMNGLPDQLYGIQKSFHPDKSLFDLKEKMENLLVNATLSDSIIQAGDGNCYKVHRAILAG